MIRKTELKRKNVSYMDVDGKIRCQTVLRISGNTLTVGIKTTIGSKRFMLNRERIHPDKNKIFGVYYRNKLVDIDWGRRK